MNLQEGRLWFDTFLEVFPDLTQYLEIDPDIVLDPAFYSGLIKISKNDIGSLSQAEMATMTSFKVKDGDDGVDEDDHDTSSLSLKEQMERKAKRGKRTESATSLYYDCLFIPYTSNGMERLFSLSKLILSHL